MAIIPANEKAFMVTNGTNTTYGGSAALKAMQQWYTMQDISDSIQPYQVFTALLTQSGGDDVSGIYEGLLTVGQTYTILDMSNGSFTGVGAPNNNVGTSFIATGTTPNWGTDSGTGVSYNNGAPVATVLENTIGNVWFTYFTQGMYTMNSNSLFTSNKTIGFAGGQQFGNSSGDPVYGMYQNNVNEIGIDTPSGNDGYLNGAPIEIRVYN